MPQQSPAVPLSTSAHKMEQSIDGSVVVGVVAGVVVVGNFVVGSGVSSSQHSGLLLHSGTHA